MPNQKLKLKPNGKFWGVGAGVKKGKFPCTRAGCKFIATSVQSLGGHQGVHRRAAAKPAAAKRLARKGKSPARKNQTPKISLARFMGSTAPTGRTQAFHASTVGLNQGENRLYRQTAESHALEQKRFDEANGVPWSKRLAAIQTPKSADVHSVPPARADTRADLAALLREHEYKAGLLRSVLGML